MQKQGQSWRWRMLRFFNNRFSIQLKISYFICNCKQKCIFFLQLKHFMYRLLIIFLLASVNAPAQHVPVKTGVSTTQYVCTIRSDKTIYHPGETPAITVEINNNSNEKAYLVRALDGSDIKRRFPYAYFTITKVGDTAYKTKMYGRCGNIDPITVADFVEVKPGALFNPFKRTIPYTDRENIFAYDIKLIDTANFSTPGKYVITFFYSTMESDFTKWGGHYSSKMFYKDYKQMEALFFSDVARISLVSNELIIEVK
jgi:hypothetical protein